MLHFLLMALHRRASAVGAAARPFNSFLPSILKMGRQHLPGTFLCAFKIP